MHIQKLNVPDLTLKKKKYLKPLEFPVFRIRNDLSQKIPLKIFFLSTAIKSLHALPGYFTIEISTYLKMETFDI